VHRFRVGFAGLHLWRLADGDVVGPVGHEILRAAGAMDAQLQGRIRVISRECKYGMDRILEKLRVDKSIFLK